MWESIRWQKKRIIRALERIRHGAPWAGRAVTGNEPLLPARQMSFPAKRMRGILCPCVSNCAHLHDEVEDDPVQWHIVPKRG